MRESARRRGENLPLDSGVANRGNDAGERFKVPPALLGEANADELWETTLNPETRTLIRITVDDLEEAMEHAMNFMADNRVDFRKKFILDVFNRVDEEALSY